mgnify:FL=1
MRVCNFYRRMKNEISTDEEFEAMMENAKKACEAMKKQQTIVKIEDIGF